MDAFIAKVVSRLPTSSSAAAAKSPVVYVTAGVVVSVGAVQLLTKANPLGRCWRFYKQLGRQENKLTCNDSVKKGIDEYSALHRNDSVESRNSQYAALVNAYYDLATVFYEWGWGNSFHFSYEFSFEGFYEAIRRHEYQLAAQLGVFGRGAHVLDVGCGIGGPMRNIGRFLDCQVTGLTLNPYQVQRGNELNAQDPTVKDTCQSVQGDFMKLPFEASTFDAAYAIEATCHAPDRTACYRQVYDCLKPGATFALYEWCMTDLYDASNPEHARMKKDIEEGNGLPDICHTSDCLKALQAAGFEVVRESDLATRDLVQPWYTPLMPSWNPLSQRFQFNPVGGRLINWTVYMLELLWLAPAGTVKTQRVLQAGGFALRDAGKEGIFTTMYLIVGRKPLAA